MGNFLDKVGKALASAAFGAPAVEDPWTELLVSTDDLSAPTEEDGEQPPEVFLDGDAPLPELDES